MIKSSMQLLRLADVPTNDDHQVFLYSRSRALLGMTLLAGTAVGAFLFSWLTGTWLGYYIGAVILGLLLIFHRLITARFRSSNWLVRATAAGLFIKFRSYLNYHFDDRDLTVIFLPYGEISSANAVKEIRELPDRDNGNRTSTRSTRRIVTLEVTSDCTALSKLLANERERIFGKAVVGAGKISTRYQHLPVRLIIRKRLQIEWGVVPKVQTFLELLARHSIPQEATRVALDFTNLETLTRPEQEQRLLELVEGGDQIGAIALARRLYAYDLTAAGKFIDELVRRHRTGVT